MRLRKKGDLTEAMYEDKGRPSACLGIADAMAPEEKRGGEEGEKGGQQGRQRVKDRGSARG